MVDITPTLIWMINLFIEEGFRRLSGSSLDVARDIFLVEFKEKSVVLYCYILFYTVLIMFIII